MVALLIFSIGLLGLAMLQGTGLKFNTDSYARTQATILAYDLIDRMRANVAGVQAGNYCITSATPCTTTAKPGTPEYCGDTGGCDSSQKLAVYDLTQWYDLQDTFLAKADTPSSLTSTVITTTPGGQALNRYTITMRWKERENDIEQTWVFDLSDTGI
jgi:type IV pilus assembly protein PilV